MKSIIIAIAVVLLAIAHTGCAIKQEHQLVRSRRNYEFDEPRINAIADLFDSTLNMLYDEKNNLACKRRGENRVRFFRNFPDDISAGTNHATFGTIRRREYFI